MTNVKFEIICGSYEEGLCTYIGHVSKSCVHNPNHGNLDTTGHYHGNYPYLLVQECLFDPVKKY